MSGFRSTTRLQHAFSSAPDSRRHILCIENNVTNNDESMWPCAADAMPEQLLTRQDVASWLQVSPKTLANWSSNGLGPKPLKLHGFVRYQRATVQAWILQTGKAAA